MKRLWSIFAGQPKRIIPWGPWRLPLSAREDHFLFMGTSGSGKTVSLAQQYAAVLRHITPKSLERAIIYDKKGDTLPILWALKERNLLHPEVPIIYFNPLDVRSHAWDIAADVNVLPLNQLDSHFQRIVNNLFPAPGPNAGRNDTFFHKKLVEISKFVLHGFALTDTPWSLRDLYCVLYDEKARNKFRVFSGICG